MIQPSRLQRRQSVEEKNMYKKIAGTEKKCVKCGVVAEFWLTERCDTDCDCTEEISYCEVCMIVRIVKREMAVQK